MKKAQTSCHNTHEDICKGLFCMLWDLMILPYKLDRRLCTPLSQTYKPLMSTLYWQLNRIILTVAYLLQILSPWGHRSEKKTALKILPSFFFLFNSSCVVPEAVLNLSVHILFNHWLYLLHHVGSSCSLLLPLCLCAPPPFLCLGGRYWKTIWRRDKGHELLTVNVCVCLCEGSDWLRKHRN